MPPRLLPRLGPAHRRHRPLHTRARTCSLLSSPPDLPLLHLLLPSRRHRVFFPSLLCRGGESMSGLVTPGLVTPELLIGVVVVEK
ncbi:hypothetical protein DY000_02057904 [Brassica cretica]|uniref:Uncharacterized protein n=1 Tax=Brassica cretica TaxID=69181 RepID=A0ABQ7A9J7_BRACR|nr:hypothetical protein DY000_02057904 [Brassica cretica]